MLSNIYEEFSSSPLSDRDLGHGSRGLDLGAEIWPSKLGFEPQVWDFGLEDGIWDLKLEFRPHS